MARGACDRVPISRCGCRRENARLPRDEAGIEEVNVATKPAPGKSDRWARIHAVVRRIPRGRVASYGQVAAVAGLAGQARQVGYALHALPEGSPVPWHRVLNARGVISLPPGSSSAITQRLRLEKEGVRFGAGGRVDLSRYGWRAGARARASVGRAR